MINMVLFYLLLSDFLLRFECTIKYTISDYFYKQWQLVYRLEMLASCKNVFTVVHLMFGYRWFSYF
jgi:hypothetical protein